MPDSRETRVGRRGFLKLAAGVAGVAAGSGSISGIPSPDQIETVAGFLTSLGPKPAEASLSSLIPTYIRIQEAAEIPLLDEKGSKEYGRFYAQTGNGKDTGFAVMNTADGRFWDAFNRLGGVDVLGYPISSVFEKEGFEYQLFQGGALQVNATQGSPDGIVLANVNDELNKIEQRNPAFAQQLRNEGVPAHLPGENISGAERLTWLNPGNYENAQDKEAVTAIRNAFTTVGGTEVSLDEAAQIKGFPTSKLENRGLFSGVRLQRGSLQYWQEVVPGHPELPQPGAVTSFLCGDLLKRGGWVSDQNALLPRPYQEVAFRPVEHFPREIGDLKTDGIVIHNKGTKIGFDIGDFAMFEEIFPPLAKKYRPGGIEWFVYDTPSVVNGKTTIGPEPAIELLRKGYQQFETHLGAYPGTFLQNSTLLIGQRPDGVTEVHIGLFPRPNANPSSNEIREVSFTLSNKIMKTIAGEENAQKIDVFESFSLLVERRVRQKNLPMPLIVTLV